MNLTFTVLILLLFKTAFGEMKGWEIYRISKNSEAKYLLVLGTNRLKTENEIVNNPQIIKFSDLLEKLKQLPKNETVTLQGGGLLEDNSKLTPMSFEEEKQILELCKRQKLNCTTTE